MRYFYCQQNKEVVVVDKRVSYGKELSIVNNDKYFVKVSEKHRQAIAPDQLQQIEAFANSIHYGSITLLIQDGVLVQIEKNEKIRINL